MSKKILLIEDEAAVASYLGAFLEREGFAVTRASTLAEARSLLDRPFDLILLDLLLPDGTGDSLLPQLCESAPTRPILMVSGVPPDDSRLVKCLKTGAAGYVSKAGPVDDLIRHIRRVFRE